MKDVLKKGASRLKKQKMKRWISGRKYAIQDSYNKFGKATNTRRGRCENYDSAGANSL